MIKNILNFRKQQKHKVKHILKKTFISGPVKFKPMWFKGQLTELSFHLFIDEVL